jgi:hypothetical protein
MKDAIAEGRPPSRACRTRPIGCGASRAPPRAARPRPRPGGRVPGGAAAVHKFMERFSSTHLRDYLNIIRRPLPTARRRGCSGRTSAPHRRQGVLRRARRDGHQLDAEPPLRPGRRGRRGGGPASSDGAGTMSQINVNSVTVLGAGTMGAQIALHCANAGIPALLLDLTADLARQGLDKARRLKPDPQFTPDACTGWSPPAASTRTSTRSPPPTGSWRPSSSGSTSSSSSSRASTKCAAPAPSSAQHVGHPDRRARRGPLRRLPPALAGHALLQPAALPAPARDHPDAGDRPRSCASVTRFGDHLLGKGVVVAKDTPNFIGNHIALYGVAPARSRRWPPASTRSRRSTPSPAKAIGRPGSATFRTMDIAGRRRAGARDAQPARAAGGRGRSRGVRRAPRSSTR